MMRKILFFLFAISFLVSCAQDAFVEKIPFTFAPQRRLMSVPLSIQGVKANMLFDTGGGPFDLDTTFAKKIAPYDSITRSFEVYVCGGFTTGDTALVNVYDGLLDVKIGTHEYNVKQFCVGDFKKTLDVKEFDGVFSLPNEDNLNVWKFDFEENSISIIPTDSFQIEDEFLILPLNRDKEGNIYTVLSLEIRTKQGKRIKTNKDFLIDTGSIADVTFMNGTDEAACLNEDKDDAYWLWNRHFWDAAINVCGSVCLDSSRVYVYHLKARTPYKRIIGLNFLKRFNVFFDMKNEKLYLQPISKFERIIQSKQFWHQVDNKIRGEKIFIENIGDYKDNEAIKSGFRAGDEVISINGIKNISSLSPEQEKQLLSENIWNYVVRRKGKVLHLKLNRHLEKQIDD